MGVGRPPPEFHGSCLKAGARIPFFVFLAKPFREPTPRDGTVGWTAYEPRSDRMKIMLLAAALITLPAIIIAVLFFGRPMMYPALASLAINVIPFLVAGWLLKGRDHEGGHH
jgi:hypothetical protein